MFWLKLFYENGSVFNEGGGDCSLMGGVFLYLFIDELYLNFRF